MPVIQLPRDTRFGDLGAGLGNLIGSAITAYTDKQKEQGVAQIMQDPSVSEADKPTKILKDFGDKGYEYYKKLIQAQVFQAQIKDTLAQTGLRTVQSKALEATLPFAAKKAETDIQHTQATTAQAAASAANISALTQPEVALKGAQAENIGAEAATKKELLPGAAAAQGALTQERRQTAGKTSLESALLQNQLDARTAIGAAEGAFDKTLEPFGLTPDEKAAAREVYNANEAKKAGSGTDAMIDYAVKRQAQKEKRAEVKPAPVDEVKTASSDAAHATSAQRFLDEFTRGGAQRIGLTRGAPLIAKLEQWGVATGDPQIVSMINAAKQQVQSTATSGGGFFAQGRVKLAQDITPAITETPLHALITMDEVADRKIAELSTRISGYEGTQVNVEPYKKALTEWQKIKQTTGTLNSYVKPDPRFPNDPTRGETVMFFQGNQIDPKSFKTYITNDDTQYPLPGGESRPGTWFFEASKPPTGPDDKFHKNVDPWTLYKMLNPRAVPYTDRRGTR